MPNTQRTALPRSAAFRTSRVHYPQIRHPQRRKAAAAQTALILLHPRLARWKPGRRSVTWKRTAAALACFILFALAREGCALHWQRVAETRVLPQRPAARAPKAEFGAAALIPSPNWDERPAGTAVSAIVLHSTATATGQEAVNTFLDPASQRSSHFIVDRNGSVIEIVPPDKRAWHAGKSALGGVPDLNNFSVGIEMVDRNDGQPYSNAQYAALASLIRQLRTRYDIPDARVVSHAAVALPLGRKSDPVGFDFPRLYAALRA
jgi:hypothetical protein